MCTYKEGEDLLEKYGHDFSDCIEGWVYAFNNITKEHLLICDQKVKAYCANFEYVYYVKEKRPDCIFQNTLDGQNENLIYDGGGAAITHLTYFYGKEGYLGFVENGTDLILYDMPERIREVVLIQESFGPIFFPAVDEPWVLYFYTGDYQQWKYDLTTKILEPAFWL